MGNTELRLIEHEGQLIYYVSNLGKVYRMMKNKPRPWQFENTKFLEYDGEWLREVKPLARSKRKDRPQGYLSVEVNGKSFSVHRLVAFAFIPNPLNKPQVNHIDGDIHNNSVDNLEWVTQSENSKHAIEVLKRKPSYGGRGRKGYKDPSTLELYSKINHLLETTILTKTDIGVLCGCTYHVVKRCHSISKVQRPSNYDYRRTRNSLSGDLGVENSVLEAHSPSSPEGEDMV